MPPTNVTTVYSKKGAQVFSNDNQAHNLLAPAGSFNGSAVFAANQLRVGDTIRLTAWGTIQSSATPGTIQMNLVWSGAANTVIGGFTGIPLPQSRQFIEWELYAMITVRPTVNILVCEGFFYCPLIDILPKGSVPIGIPDPLAPSRLDQIGFQGNRANELRLNAQLSVQNPTNVIVLEHCVIEYLATPTAAPGMTMGPGSIDGLTSPATFAPTGSDTGTLSATAVYSSGAFYGATAFWDLGTTNNTASVTFTYQGSEAAGGAAVGVRWNDSAKQGIFAYIDSSGPTVKIYEMSSGWVFVQTSKTSLTLTTGKSYTLTLSDDGSTATASITDDVGRQTCNISTTLNKTNTEATFGWIGNTASHAFSAVITDIEGTQSATVATPMFSPYGGTYNSTQSVAITTYTSGAAIHYTTDGSIPKSTSPLYTVPISVSASKTLKAIAILAAWTDSAIGSAAYTIAPWTMEAGTIDGTSSGTIIPTGNDKGVSSSSAVYMTATVAASGAVAYQDLGTTNNSPSITFVYENEAHGGPCVGTRWDHSAQSGFVALMNGSTVYLYQMSAGWVYVTQASLSLTLTVGNSYTLSIVDNGSKVAASITDDIGVQGISITSSTGNTRTQVAFGWMYAGVTSVTTASTITAAPI